MRPRWRTAPPRARFRTGRRERRDATGVGGRGRIMTEVEARTFLDRFPAEELAARRVLNGDTRLLNNRSVTPLIELMAEHDVSRLVAPGRDWFLDADGTFRNPRSVEATSGNVESLRNPGNVFSEQNTSLNPHYARAQGPDAEDAGDVTFGLERDLQRAAPREHRTARVRPRSRRRRHGAHRRCRADRHHGEGARWGTRGD